MKKNICIVFLLLFVKLFLFSQNYVADEYSKIQISWAIEDGMFPYSWLKSPINGKAIPLKNDSEIKRTISIIEKALKKYPVNILSKNITKIYIVERIMFYDVDYGATSSYDKVYITDKGKTAGYSDEYIEQAFHHEFNHLLFFKYPQNFNEAAWESCNPVGFKYGKGGADAIKEGSDSEAFSEKVNKEGFLNIYSKSSLKEDLAEFVQNIFLPETGFYDIVGKNKNIRKKVSLAIDFYNSLNTVFTEKYFNEFIKN
jgi:hypothetical protein